MTEQEKLLLMAQRSRLSYADIIGPTVVAPAVEVSVTEEVAPTCAGKTTIVLYRPQQDIGGPLPVFVNIHGGGFIQGSTKDDDGWCRQIAVAVGCTVVSIEYHLAPEYKFPIPMKECYDVLKWVHEQASGKGFDPERIAVGGSSAGGNFAAALCLLARERKEFSLVDQVLKYPPRDFSIDPELKGNSDALLTPRAQAFFSACYLHVSIDETNPLASPLLAENLTGLPPALIIAAEHDPLRIEDEEYGKRLAAAGVPVTFRMFEGCMHAFTHFGPEPSATEAWSLIHDRLKQVFWGASGETA